MFTLKGLKNNELGHKRDPALNNKGAPVPRLFAEKHLADRHFADSTFDRPCYLVKSVSVHGRRDVVRQKCVWGKGVAPNNAPSP